MKVVKVHFIFPYNNLLMLFIPLVSWKELRMTQPFINLKFKREACNIFLWFFMEWKMIFHLIKLIISILTYLIPDKMFVHSCTFNQIWQCRDCVGWYNIFFWDEEFPIRRSNSKSVTDRKQSWVLKLLSEDF